MTAIWCPPAVPVLAGFEPLPENRAALQAVSDLAEAVLAGAAAVPLFLHGPPGSGKSHLAEALADAVVRGRPDAVVRAISARELDEVADAAELLIIEDVQYLRSPGRLAQLWDQQTSESAGMLLTSTLSPGRLDTSARVASRLRGGLVVRLGSLGQPSRRQLLEVMTHRAGVNVPGAVIDWLSQRLAGNGRGLEGAVQQLAMLKRLHGSLTLDMIAELWGDAQPGQPDLGRIVAGVADHYGLRPSQLTGPGRQPSIVRPRQIAMYLARQLAGRSFEEIGRHFSGRDHSTVLHACRKIEADAAGDEVLAGALRQLLADLA